MNDGTWCTGRSSSFLLFFGGSADSKQDQWSTRLLSCLEMESSLRIKFQGLTAFLCTLCNCPNAHHVHHSTHCRASCFRQFHQQSTINKYVKCLPCARSCVEHFPNWDRQRQAHMLFGWKPVTDLTHYAVWALLVNIVIRSSLALEILWDRASGVARGAISSSVLLIQFLDLNVFSSLKKSYSRLYLHYFWHALRLTMLIIVSGKQQRDSAI